MQRRRPWCKVGLLLLCASSACSSESSDETSGHGGAGAHSGGGGGEPQRGGSSGSGGSSAGRAGSGGETGGTLARGGGEATGGSQSGSSSGAESGRGGEAGAMATGGAPNVGGSPAQGGVTSGGSNATGGAAGGAKASGGAAGTGGAGAGGAGTGGAGGAKASGGSAGAGGAKATGGSAGAGGAKASGGSAGAGGAGKVQVTSDFTSDTEGWQGAFSDYPQGQETFYELECQQEALPTSLGAGGGILMGGNNHSDDLFMYLARRITGLKPAASYTLDVTVLIGSNAPSDCGGIGGAPGTSLYFKIGGSPLQPASTLDNQGFLRLNLDKGQQSASGTDMKVVGDIGNTLRCPDDAYQAKTLSLSGFIVQSAADGSVWVVVGTDSGFEGITQLYYDRISLTLTPAN